MGTGAARKLILAAALVAGTGAVAQECRPDTVQLRGDWGEARFTVEVADDPAERAVGLMNRPSMPKSAGMLFVYDRAQRVSFWMENTLIPLDMIFADADGVVQNVHHEAVPLDRTSIPGEGHIQYVLEINGGLARAMGIGPGTQLRHPSIGPDPAWPC